jgi:hypothetical protein
MDTSHTLQAAPPTPAGALEASAVHDVTLRVTNGDARRIVRALEETSVRCCVAPGGSRLAGNYMRLAGNLKQQASYALKGS